MVVDSKGGGLTGGRQLLTIAIQERPDGIDTIDGCIPCLRALLLQEPATHLVNGLLVVGSYLLDSLDSCHLSGYLIVVPRIRGTRGIVVAAHLVGEDGIFLQTLHILLSQLGVSTFSHHDSSHRLSIDRLTLDVFLQQDIEIVVGRLHAGWQLTTIQSADVEPAQGSHRREHGLNALLLLLLHLCHQLNHLLTEIVEGSLLQLTGILLQACHLIQAHQHLHHCHRDIGTALHAGIPGERTIATLQFLQLLDSRSQSMIDGVGIEEIGQTLFLFSITIGSEKPRGFLQKEIFQFFIL